MANVQLGYGHSDAVGVPFDYYAGANIATAFAITMITSFLVLAPTGTLATGAVTLPLNPPDGCLAEISSTQTQTAVTVSANTGDTIVGTAVTALVANTRVAYRYSLNGSQAGNAAAVNARTWNRVQ